MDELFDRKTPSSLTAEQSVIGAMLIDPSCIPKVVGLSGEDFYYKTNREIYETMFSMFSFGRNIDAVTLIDEMKSRGVYGPETENYIAETVRVTPTSANVGQYVKIVADKALLRKLGETADEINELVYQETGSADKTLELAEKKIFSLSQNRSLGGLRRLSEIMPGVFDEIVKQSETDNNIPGLSTGLGDLDKLTLGLNKSELIIIAARPGMGKTSIALNIALTAAMNNKKKVAIFSLEMSRQQLAIRLLSRASLVPSSHLLTGRLSPDEWKEITGAAKVLSGTEILIDDNSALTVSEMNAACRRVKDLDLVIIDYLQLMQSAGSGHSWSNESRTQAVSDISRMMKIMAKELNVPVICLSQLSRENEKRGDKRPALSDLRESGSIEQDADVVIGLYREGYYNREIENPNLAEAIVLKNRKGATGTVMLNWMPDYTTFTGLDSRHEDE